MSDVFCRLSLSEVVSVERNLRSDALLKRDELRELVGSRYRSLLACADAIHQMSVLGEEGEVQLQTLHGTLLAIGSKAASLSASASEEEEALRVERRERLTASENLSTLVHATERILDALDRQLVLEAAQLYIDAESAAQHVLDSKQEDASVWNEVWDGVKRCRDMVRRTARDVLWNAHSVASDRNALRALCLLDEEASSSSSSSSSRSLELLLSARAPVEGASLRIWALVVRRTLEELQQWFSDGSIDRRGLHSLCDRWWQGVVERIATAEAAVGRQSAEERDEILSVLYADDGVRVWSTAALACIGRQLDVWSEAFDSRVCTLLIDEAREVNHHLADNLHTHLQHLHVRVSSSERHWSVLRAADPNSSTLDNIIQSFQTDLDAMLSHHQRLRCTSLSEKWQQTRLVRFIKNEVAPATQESAEQALRRVVEVLQQAMQSAERMSEGPKVETIWFLCRLSFGVAQVCEGVPSSMPEVLDSFWALIDASLSCWIVIGTRSARLQLDAAVRDAFHVAECIDTTQTSQSELVPLDASPFALVYLNAVTTLIDAVLYESVTQPFLERLLSQLLQSSASLFEQLLDDIDIDASSVPEGFFVQLLFDASFLLFSSSAAAAVLERISSHIDPISLASVESQLRTNVDLYRQRCSVLLGCLAGAAPSAKSMPAPKPSDPNLIELLHPSKRLPTFLVTMYPSTENNSDSLKLELEIENDDEMPRQVSTVSSGLAATDVAKAAASKFISQVQANRPNFASIFNQLSGNKNS